MTFYTIPWTLNAHCFCFAKSMMTILASGIPTRRSGWSATTRIGIELFDLLGTLCLLSRVLRAHPSRSMPADNNNLEAHNNKIKEVGAMFLKLNSSYVLIIFLFCVQNSSDMYYHPNGHMTISISDMTIHMNPVYGAPCSPHPSYSVLSPS